MGASPVFFVCVYLVLTVIYNILVVSIGVLNLPAQQRQWLQLFAWNVIQRPELSSPDCRI